MTHLGRHLFRIEDDVVPYHLIVRQGDEGIHLFDSFDIYLIRNIGLELYRIHVEGFAIINVVHDCVGIPEVEKAI